MKGVDNGQFAVPREINELMDYFAKQLKPKLKECFDVCSTVAHDDLDDVLAQPDGCESVYQVVEALTQAVSRSANYLVELKKSLVLARCCGDSWAECAQRLRFVDLVRRLCSLSTSCLTSLNDVLEAAALRHVVLRNSDKVLEPHQKHRARKRLNMATSRVAAMSPMSQQRSELTQMKRSPQMAPKSSPKCPSSADLNAARVCPHLCLRAGAGPQPHLTLSLESRCMLWRSSADRPQREVDVVFG